MSRRVRSPHEQVTGIIDDPTRAEATVQALRDAGFAEDGIQFFMGEEAVATIDPDGRGHGVLGRLTRGLDRFGQEGEEHRAAAAEAQAGALLVAVSVADEREKDLAAATLRGHGAHRLRYWGRWDIELISD